MSYAIFDENFQLYSPVKTIAGGTGVIPAQLYPSSDSWDGKPRPPEIWVFGYGSNGTSSIVKRYEIDGNTSKEVSFGKSITGDSKLFMNTARSPGVIYGLSDEGKNTTSYMILFAPPVTKPVVYGSKAVYSPKYMVVENRSSSTGVAYILDNHEGREVGNYTLTGSDGNVVIAHPKFDIMLCGKSFGWGGSRSFESVDLNTATALGTRSLNTNGITVPIYKEGTNYAWLGKDDNNNGLVMDKSLNIIKTVPNGDYVGSSMAGGNICLPDDNGGCWVLTVGSSNAAGFSSRVQHINNDCKVDKTITLPTELQSLYNSTDIGSSAIEFTMLVESR